MLRLGFFTLAFLTMSTIAAAADVPSSPISDPDNVVLENPHLRVIVTPIGARIVSLFDKARNCELIKVHAYVGGANDIRYGSSLNINDTKDRFALVLSKQADGTQIVTATTRTQPTDDKPIEATVIKQYSLAPDASRVAVSLEFKNHSTQELGVIPWIRHLISRGLKTMPEDAHMTTHGAFLSGKPNPIRREEPYVAWAHYFPAANWTSSVLFSDEPQSSTLATVTRPGDTLKVYYWRKSNEDFGTQELIAAPLFAPPGQSARCDYFLAVTAPVRNIVYVSPQLILGVSPHPTWLAASQKELTLTASSTVAISNLVATARLVKVQQPDAPPVEFKVSFGNVSPAAASQQSFPVTLEDHTAYQLRLSFTRENKPWNPGELNSERGDIIIPLVVGSPKNSVALFPTQAQQPRLRLLQPQERRAPVALSSSEFDAFTVPSAQRVFRHDNYTAASKGSIELTAAANEYESAQLVLKSKLSGAVTYQVAASPLLGPAGSPPIACDSVNQFLYVTTSMPSLYNALFPIGEYPEGLLPTQTFTVSPTGSHPLFVTYRVPAQALPGEYRGTITLTRDQQKHEIPVRMTVWNVRMPVSSRRVEVASSLKGDTLPQARNADGTPLSRAEQLEKIVDMHLKYRMTPCDSGLGTSLLRSEFATVEKQMPRFIAGGATKIFLGNIPNVLKIAETRMPEIEQYLQAKGWSDYFYVRPGFDEASPDLVPQIKEMCARWKKISRIPIMETYYPDARAEELFGSLDIWCRNFPLPSWSTQRSAAGDRFWKVNAMPSVLEDEPWISARRRYVMHWDHHLTGTYLWTTKFWSGIKDWKGDPWVDGGVANLSAILMWPHETGILSSIRLEAMRDGLEDCTLLWMLRDRVDALRQSKPATPAQTQALARAQAICDGKPLSSQMKSIDDYLRLRNEAGQALSELNTQFPQKEDSKTESAANTETKSKT